MPHRRVARERLDPRDRGPVRPAEERLFDAAMLEPEGDLEVEDAFAAGHRLLVHALLFETDEGRAEVDRLDLKPSADGPQVVLHPGCGVDGTPLEWPLPNYAVLGNWLIQKHDARIVITGGPAERI
mgnify:CR=1 FL=1